MKTRIPLGIALLAAALMVLSPSAAHALEMKAGTAKTVITPEDETPRVLVTGAKHKGVHHDIYARALVLNDGANRLAVVTYDLNCLDVARNCAAEEKQTTSKPIDRTRLLIASSTALSSSTTYITDCCVCMFATLGWSGKLRQSRLLLSRWF